MPSHATDTSCFSAIQSVNPKTQRHSIGAASLSFALSLPCFFFLPWDRIDRCMMRGSEESLQPWLIRTSQRFLSLARVPTTHTARLCAVGARFARLLVVVGIDSGGLPIGPFPWLLGEPGEEGLIDTRSRVLLSLF
jgi:hypothetical protein